MRLTERFGGLRVRRLSRCVLAAAAALVVVSCDSKNSRFGATAGGSGGSDDGGSYATFGSGVAPAGDGGPCVNLQCQQVDCSGKNLPADATTVSGVVYDPAGQHPVYNAIVYVPNEPVKPFTQGVVCDQCGILTTGNPVVTALSIRPASSSCETFRSAPTSHWSSRSESGGGRRRSRP